MKATITRWSERGKRAVTAARERSGLVDHLFRAKDRYDEAMGGRLAAAISYFGFFALFALSLVLFAVLGFLVEYQIDISATVDEYLSENLPVVDTSQIAAGRTAAGLFGLVGLVLTGLGWVEALRSSQRAIWRLDEQPGSALVRRLGDVVVLLVLAALLGVSFAIATGVEALLTWLPGPVQTGIAWLLTIAINVVLAVGLLAALPRLRIARRRLLPPALVVAAGFFILNTLGQAYVAGVQENPAYAVVATAAGVLVYLYLFNQLLLLGAAVASTNPHGRVVDLAGGGEVYPEGTEATDGPPTDGRAAAP